jgi:NTE family protein
MRGGMSSTAEQRVQTKEMDGVGLVLSGGGARGVAHVGVIKFLEEIGVLPNVVAGTSAGALVGSLYAAGYNAQVMLDFFLRTTVFSPKNYAFRKPGLIDLEGFIPVFKEMIPHDTFEGLGRKLFVVATDMEKGERKVFRAGELIRPVLASAAMPFVFPPVEIDGVLYSDGGITDNFPVELLTDAYPRTIGVYVNPLAPAPRNELDSSIEVLLRAYHVGVHEQVRNSFAKCTVLITPELNDYTTLGMQHLQAIHDLGYAAAKCVRSKLLKVLGG